MREAPVDEYCSEFGCDLAKINKGRKKKTPVTQENVGLNEGKLRCWRHLLPDHDHGEENKCEPS